MIEQHALQAIAREILDARDRPGTLIPYQDRTGGFDIDCAYAVAELVHQARLATGWVPLGRKIGFTNAAIWDVYGVRAPIWSYVYDRTVTYLIDGRGICSLNKLAEPKIEPEIVVHFRAAPPATGDLAAILACVDWIAHGFEIVQSHYRGWKFQIADTIADCGLHGQLFVGTPASVAELGTDVIDDLARFSIELSCDGKFADRGTGGNVLGHPLAAIAHLVALLKAQPNAPPIKAGELVTTGTLTAAMPIEVGQTWRTHLQGIALAGLELTCQR
jgi:2-oxo-3-hexenedioate decarboxylase